MKASAAREIKSIVRVAAMIPEESPAAKVFSDELNLFQATRRMEIISAMNITLPAMPVSTKFLRYWL